MRITKYEHACIIIEEQDKRLVIDPGNFVKTSLSDLDNVVGIVITHVHADHFDPDHLKTILEKNRLAKIFCTDEVAQKLAPLDAQVVTGDSSGEVAPFKLRFFGGVHATIHASWPNAQNVGVFVNDILYYPGDSFTLPDRKVSILALPVSAPWLKLSEVMDFLTAIKPQIAFPTHNALLSDIGINMVDQILSGVAESAGSSLKVLAIGQSLDV